MVSTTLRVALRATILYTQAMQKAKAMTAREEILVAQNLCALSTAEAHVAMAYQVKVAQNHTQHHVENSFHMAPEAQEAALRAPNVIDFIQRCAPLPSTMPNVSVNHANFDM